MSTVGCSQHRVAEILESFRGHVPLNIFLKATSALTAIKYVLDDIDEVCSAVY